MKIQDRIRKVKQKVIKIQRGLYGPPKRVEIKRWARKLLSKYQLTGTNVEGYMKLWIICALLNQEALHRYWKPSPLHYKRARRVLARWEKLK